MRQSSNRDEIKRDFEEFISLLVEDQKAYREVIETLAVSGAQDKSPQEANMIVYKASIVELIIKLSWLTINQAEYCDYYIDKNEGCHKAHLDELKKIRESIKPFIEVKRDFMGIANINAIFKKSPFKLLEWSALIAAAKYLHIFDAVPK